MGGTGQGGRERAAARESRHLPRTPRPVTRFPSVSRLTAARWVSPGGLGLAWCPHALPRLMRAGDDSVTFLQRMNGANGSLHLPRQSTPSQCNVLMMVMAAVTVVRVGSIMAMWTCCCQGYQWPVRWKPGRGSSPLRHLTAATAQPQHFSRLLPRGNVDSHIPHSLVRNYLELKLKVSKAAIRTHVYSCFCLCLEASVVKLSKSHHTHTQTQLMMTKSRAKITHWDGGNHKVINYHQLC